jgi:hypothetical protein
VEPRLVPVNAVIDLCTLDGLNPAPFLEAGWTLVGLEVPISTRLGTVVCDLVLFQPSLGRLAVVEAKSGANLEEPQAQKLALLSPQALVTAGGITVPQPVPLSCETVFACLEEHCPRIERGVEAAGIHAAVLRVGQEVTVSVVGPIQSEIARAIPSPLSLPFSPARLIPFDHESPDEIIDQVVEAELTVQMSRLSPVITVRALTERIAPFYGIYGKAAQGRLQRRVAGSAGRAASREPNRLRVDRRTGASDDVRIMIVGSPERFDRRGRTQSYQSLFSARPASGRRRSVQVAGQIDLFDELDRAEGAGSLADSEEVHETQGADPSDVAVEAGDDGGTEPAASPPDEELAGQPQSTSEEGTK